MNDEISAARRKKRRRYNLKRGLRFILALLTLLLAAFALSSFNAATFKDTADFFVSVFSPAEGWPAALGESEPLQTETLSYAFASLTDEELIVVSRRGARLMSERHSLVSPFIAASGNRIALCNRGSREVIIYNRSREIAAFSAEGAIIDAAISEKGALAILTQSELYTSELAVYKNGLYERAMTWKGAQGFPLMAAVSPDGRRAAAVTLSVSGGVLSSTVTVIDVQRESEQSAASFEGMVCELLLENDGGFTAITDSEVLRFNSSGELSASYEFPSSLLIALDCSSSHIALAFGDNSSPSINSLLVLSRSLELQGEIVGCGAVNSLKLCGERVYVLGSGRLTAYTCAGRVIKIYKSDIK
ncbi:MAG: DUF5711 family protein, partial [Oscillospiraceae bacterium]|nr:DUF5711 family protein [Oscillospiraceae bacterium]